MANRFVRSSKFRHVFGTASKPDQCYAGIRVTKSPHESNMCSVNAKFLAVVLESQGGGAFLVAPLDKVGRFDINYPKVSGHKSGVLDLAWNPFDDNEIASASEDCTIKLWTIPDEGLKDVMTEPRCTLEGHQRKVTYVLWHPCASDVLASASADNCILIWNTQTEEPIVTIEGIHGDLIQSICWNYNGSHIASTCKDKKLRVMNAHTGEVVSEGQGHVGTKPSKVVFCGKSNKLFTTGFSRQSERQYALWDTGDLSKPLCIEGIDNGTGVLFPFWDDGTSMVYIAGKGDSQIKYFEITDASPYVFFLSMYQSTSPQRGCGCMPKRNLEYMKCEVMRFYKIHNKGLVEPIPMTVPRKSDMFQSDIFPPTFAGKPALSVDEWAAGQDKDPLLLAFSKTGLSEFAGGEKSKPITGASKVAAAAPEKKEPAVLKRYRSTDSPEGLPAVLVTLDDYKAAYKAIVEENEKLKKELAQCREGK